MIQPAVQRARCFALVAVGLAGLGLLQSEASAQSEAPDFSTEIRPLLAARCFTCHGLDEDVREAELRLDDADAAMAELPSGARAIVPGERAASELFSRISATDAGVRMPPEGAALTAEEIDRIGQWIDGGAEYAAHWSYVRPTKPKLPAAQNSDWAAGPIDRFILSELERRGHRPAVAAEPGAIDAAGVS